jgi:replicative DNA helicase
MLRDTEVKPKQFLLTDSLTGMTVSAIAAKVNTVNPDVLFVDGAYLMLDETTGEAGTPQSLTNITRSLKRLAQRANICVVVSTQSLLWKQKKNVVSADSIGYSSSWLQDSDVVLGLQRTEDDDPNIRTLKIVASRNCPVAEVDMLFDWELGEFREDTP